jgi:hypothetical protein
MDPFCVHQRPKETYLHIDTYIMRVPVICLHLLSRMNTEVCANLRNAARRLIRQVELINRRVAADSLSSGWDDHQV